MAHSDDIQAEDLLIAENFCSRQQLVLQRRYPRRRLAIRIVAFADWLV
jgi:hypothetical protein